MTKVIVEIGGNTINVIIAEDMPIGMPEHIWKNSDDSFTLKLNAKYDQETLRAAFRHALKHIRNDDWQKSDVQQIEAQAHGLSEAQNYECTTSYEPSWFLEIVNNMRTQSYIMNVTQDYMMASRECRNSYPEYRINDDTFLANEATWQRDE